MKGFMSVVMFILLAQPSLALEPYKQKSIGSWQVIKARTVNHGISCQALLRASNGSLLLFGSKNRNAVTPLIGLGSGYPKGSKAIVRIGSHNFEFYQPKPAGPNRFFPVAETDDAKIVDLLLANRTTRIIARGKDGQFTLKAKRVKQVFRFFEKHCQISTSKSHG